MICLYKIGLAITPGEVLNWTRRIRKLTSVKHHSVILRISHGDVYSNSRLYKFGMIDNPLCNNCSAPLETIIHKVLECPKVGETWQLLNIKKERIGLAPTELTIEGILGIRDCGKLE